MINAVVSRIKSKPGDTIVEVMVGLVLLGSVLATAYAITNRSLSSGQSAAERTQALASAQSQIEFIIAAQKRGQSLDKFKQVEPFCILPDGISTQKATKNLDGTLVCQPYGDGKYGLGVAYSSNGLFSVTARWESATSGLDQDRLNLYYRPQN